ncbi:MAG: right-handed parallel beta-helix repeat-containing protein [Clostridiales bacterium]|nr:right-handed parallel beta-helix repeat-containing protein [Clostridiales bacterium]
MKKLTALLLALAMAFSLAVSPALAADLTADAEGIVVDLTDAEDNAAEEASVDEGTEEEAPADETEATEDGSADEEASTDEETEEEVSADEEANEETVTVQAQSDADEEADATVAAQATSSYTLDTTNRLITVTAVDTGEDIRANVKAALQKARDLATASAQYTVKVPAGSYALSAKMEVYSNTTLDLTGVTLTYSGDSGLMLVCGTRGDDGQGGYVDNVNITILGGTLKGNPDSSSGLVQMAHGNNITFDGVTFQDCGGHHSLEVAGIKNFTVTNCTFRDQVFIDSTNACEALNMDVLGSTSTVSGYILDGTTMQNVTITNNTFTNCPRGVGIHNQILGSYNTGLEIANNTFSNLGDAAIHLVAFVDCSIHDNTITNCGYGIYFAMFSNSAKQVLTTVNGEAYSGTVVSNANSTITDNTITATVVDADRNSKPVGIYLYGEKLSSATKSSLGSTVPAGTYGISGVTVSGNTIKTSGYGIRMDQTASCTVKSNTVTYSASSKASDLDYCGIYAQYGGSGNSITSNTVKSFSDFGIKLVSSAASSITSNKVSSCGSYGIYCNASKVTNLKSNTLSSNGNYGIYLASGSAVTTLSSNKISGSKGGGLYVKSSKATNITSNTITSTANYGIYLYSITGSSTVKSNTVSGYKCPLRLNNSTSYTVTVASNTLTGKTSDYCIKVDKGKVSVYSNTLSKGKAPFYSAKGVKGTIKKNTIKSCTSSKYVIKGTKSYNAVVPSTPSVTAKKAASKKLKVSWKKISGVTGYQIEYSTSSSFSSSKTVKVTSASTVSKTITGLTKGKKYYVRVRAYTTCNSVTLYGAYSATKSATV